MVGMTTQPWTRMLSSQLGLPLLLALSLAVMACSSDEAVGTPAADSSADAVIETDLEAEDELEAETDPEAETEDEPQTETELDGQDLLALDLFLDGALVGDPALGDCELSDGSQSQCYMVTVVGTPVNHDVGPFCPTDISQDSDAGGLWLDGVDSFEIDGAFFTELSDIYGDELWDNIYNDDGTINVIDNAADFQVAARPDITEEFYYHCVDGDVTWLDGGEQPTHTIEVPAVPALADEATVQFATGAHSNLGVTLNGALLSGSADMTAILASYTIAAFDDCGGHINPALGYHVHGTAGCSDVGETADGETAPFAYAIDGFTIHAPYEAGVDVELDECNGHVSEEYGYHYHAASLEENATLTCLNGLTAAGQDAGGRPARPDGERPARPEPQD